MRLLLISLSCALVINAQSDGPPLVETLLGDISGKRIDVDGKPVNTFLGIPYAKPPLGDLRYERPVPIEPFNETFAAKKLPLNCMQVTIPLGFQWLPFGKKSEDCLYLNIWQPVTNDTLPKAVMVWIHGGGFISGSSSVDIYNGATLASKGDVIVVSLNYRLGSFGFLNLGIQEASGNMGLFDQHLALRWIKANINCFGGDPSRITLFGESAGSMSISIHLISPISHGLFNRAILQSGTAYQPSFFITEQKSMERAKKFVDLMGCGNYTYREEVLGCLKKKEARDIVKTEAAMYLKYEFLMPRIGDEIIPREPSKAMDAEMFYNTDIMIGDNENEGSIFLLYLYPFVFLKEEETANLNKSEAMRLLTEFAKNGTDIKEVDRIVDIYFQNANNRSEIIDAFAKAVGDWAISCPTIYLANKFASKYNRAYFYHFTHDHNPSALWPEWVKATHFDEVPYVFGDPLSSDEEYTDKDKRFSKHLISLWTSFAKGGEPKSPFHYYWPPYTPSNPRVLELNADKIEIKIAPRYEICTKVWGPLYFQSPLRQLNWPVWFHF